MHAVYKIPVAIANFPWAISSKDIIAGSTTGVSGYIDGPLLVSQFTYPTSLALDEYHNCLYVGESSSIRKLSFAAGNVSTVFGTGMHAKKFKRLLQMI